MATPFTSARTLAQAFPFANKQNKQQEHAASYQRLVPAVWGTVPRDKVGVALAVHAEEGQRGVPREANTALARKYKEKRCILLAT